LGAKPYLWVSQLMLVTPFSLKSKSSVSKPAFSKKGTRNDPRQQSTCNGILRFTASLERAVMSSIIPWGKLGAEPTRSTVLLLMSRETLLTSTWYVGAVQATRWTLMPKYEPALRKLENHNGACLIHLWLRDTPLSVSLLSCTQTSHQNRLRSSTGSNTSCPGRRIE
jgi:hypothetical protein